MQFDFGRNWDDFSRHALNRDRVEQARQDFISLMDGIPLPGSSFLDIGFGQGLSLLSATSFGAHAVGCDINPLCGEVLKNNRPFFPDISSRDIPIVIGSILDGKTMSSLKPLAPDASGLFDIVHSWGVLHHTGDMKAAIDNAASLVKPGGYLVIALYNRHWSSPAWLLIKRLYCASPSVIRRLMVYLFYPVIWTAKLMVTGESPSKKSRGMDFFYDIVDWVGGYPYEYATISEVKSMVEKLGFDCIRTRAAEVPTGCNEYVFHRHPGPGDNLQETEGDHA